ncbi:MAG: lipoate--protein ligase family protein [Thaumarchaeota archaeon]|nr:lipoate--protein ligase family protein [Nitrososphaerota archaeon]
MLARFISTDISDPRENFALEESIFRLLEKPVFRVWSNGTSVIIGRAQLARVETDMEYLTKERIPVVRRFTAGGAVFNGPGNLNWSIFVPARESGGINLGHDARRVFEGTADIVTKALSRCGVDSRFDPPNRIWNGDGKISGMAAYLSRDGVLCHGTLLTHADLDFVRRVTTPVDVELDRKYVRSNPSPMTNCGARRGEFEAAVRTELSELGFDLEASQLRDGEEKLKRELLSNKYLDDSWNLGDPFARN